MDWLEKILDGVPGAPEIADRIKSELPKNFIPKERYNELAESKRALEQKFSSEAEARIRGAALTSALKIAAERLEARDPDVLGMLVDRDALTVSEDGTVSGLQEQLDSIRKNKPYLFGGDTLAGRTPLVNARDSSGVTRERFESMGYRERLRLFEEQPELYRNLTGN